MAAVIDFEQLLHEGLVATENVECSTIIKKKDCSIKAKSTGYQVRGLYCGTIGRNKS